MPCERKHIEAIERVIDRDEQFIDAATTVALRAAIAAALAACDESPWRSMESAPKDGSTVDLWGDDERTADCHWNHSRSGWTYWGDTGFGDMGWRVIDFVPTHWMPMPAAPEVKLDEVLGRVEAARTGEEGSK